MTDKSKKALKDWERHAEQDKLQNSLRSSGASLTDPFMAAKHDLERYLNKYVNGYLFSDLESIATKIPANLHPGAAGYPMILTICSGMELLGALLKPTNNDKFKDNDGKKYFSYYWENYLSRINPEYEKYGKISRTLVRNGLAHLFMTKPRIGVVKSNSDLHLKKVDDHLVIDATKLYQDFKLSYDNYAKPVILDGNTGTQLASNRLQQIISQYTAESDRSLQNLLKSLEDEVSTSTTTLPPTIS